MKPLYIGNLKLKNRLFLAPMLDVTNLPYRLICRKAGAAMAYTEMIYTDSILHENKKTKTAMKRCKEDSPLGIQITGNNEEEFNKVIPYLKKYDLVDLNCGCPSSKIIGSKAGSFLLQNPKKIAGIIKILKSAGLIVTLKIRLGVKKNNVLNIAKEIVEAGADAITLHPRLAIHGNNIPADWRWIRKLKETVKIPVIGNGDVFSPRDAERMLKICDGAMIGRGAIGDPLIFSRILKYLETGKEEKPNIKENLKLFSEYLNLAEKYNTIEIAKIKYIGSSFIKGFEGAAKKRNEFMKLKEFDKIRNFVLSLMKSKFRNT